MSTESTRLIEEKAGDWLARRDSGAWSALDQQAFDAWIGESMLHRVAYLRLESAWDEALRLKALGAGIQSEHPPPPGEWNLSPFFTQRAEAITPEGGKSRLWSRALAASLVIAVGIGAVWTWWPSKNTYVTPVGGVASLPMPDGSKVVLNTNSEIKVAINETERRIELTHGEAFFDVAKDPSRPFVVAVGDKRIVVLGTKFSVRRDVNRSGDDVQVLVTEGSVRLDSSLTPLPPGEGPGVRVLTAGSVARANNSGLMLQHKQLPEAEEQLSWRTGVLIFRDITLADAASEFNRYNDRKIIIKDAATADLRIAGNFRTTNVDAFVRLLEQGYPVRTEIQSKEIVVRAR